MHELSTEGFKSSVSVIRLRSLKANNIRSISKSTSVLIIITGVGKHAAMDAAQWVADNLDPLYVINYGSCAANNCPLGGLIFQFIERVPPFPTLHVSHLLVKNVNTFKDMESETYHIQFKKNHIPFFCIKTVSDRNDSKKIQDFNQMLPHVRLNFEALFYWLYHANEIKPSQISVIIPTFNRQYTLFRCIDSVLSQTVKPGEIIVVNDGSYDNTMRCLNRYLSKLKILSYPINRGVAYARNQGIKASTGKWIMLLDSDDEWESNKVESQICFLENNPYSFIFQSQELWYRHCNLISQPKHLHKKEGWIFNHSLNRCMISPSSVCIHRHLFERFGVFNETFWACEDYDMWLKITRFYPVGLDSTASLRRYAGHPDQLSSSVPLLDHYRVLALFTCLYTEKETETKEKIKAIINKKLGILINGAKKRGFESKRYSEMRNSLHLV